MPAKEAPLRTHGSLSIIRHRWAILTLTLAWSAAEVITLDNVKCLLSTFSHDCCRRPGTNACKSQESLQQVVTHADLNGQVPITSKIYVGGMCCPSEVPIIRSALGNLQGVIKVSNEPAGIGCSHCIATTF